MENRRWIVRSTNNGFTVSVDPYGRILQPLPPDVRAAADLPYDFRGSSSASISFGAIFDAPQYRERLIALEARVADPNFWSNQEAAQGVLRERKRAEEQIAADEKLTSISGDIETYIHLVQEETNVEQKNDLLKELDRELGAADTYISELETKTLLSGETDHLNAIMTIKPGAGGTESQDWASILLRMYLRWAERRGMTASVLRRHAVTLPLRLSS